MNPAGGNDEIGTGLGFGVHLSGGDFSGMFGIEFVRIRVERGHQFIVRNTVRRRVKPGPGNGWIVHVNPFAFGTFTKWRNGGEGVCTVGCLAGVMTALFW